MADESQDDLEALLAEWDPEEYVAWLDRDDSTDDGRDAKRPISKTTYHEMTPKHVNPNGQVHGGEIVKRMDTLAGITATDYAETAVTTASIDKITFHEPVDVNDTLYLESRVDYVGDTSMMIHVDAYVEDYTSQERRHTTDAYFTFVALDAAGSPTLVPELVLETADEEARYRDASQVKDYLSDR